jgi:hypothetical protein
VTLTALSWFGLGIWYGRADALAGGTLAVAAVLGAFLTVRDLRTPQPRPAG